MKKEKKGEQIKKNISVFLIRYFRRIVFTLTIIILLIGFFFLVLPKYKQISREIKLTSQGKKAEYLERQQYSDLLTKIKAEYQAISSDDIDKISVILPNKKEHEELLAQLEAIVSESGLLLVSLHIKEEKAQDKLTPRRGGKAEKDDLSGNNIPEEINKVAIKMEIVGTDYASFKNILKAIENNLRLMDIVDLSFSPAENKTSLEMFAYYME
jgi:hypothetical protein